MDAGSEEIVDTNVCHEWTLATPEFQRPWPAFTAKLLIDHSGLKGHNFFIFLNFRQTVFTIEASRIKKSDCSVCGTKQTVDTLYVCTLGIRTYSSTSTTTLHLMVSIFLSSSKRLSSEQWLSSLHR